MRPKHHTANDSKSHCQYRRRTPLAKFVRLPTVETGITTHIKTATLSTIKIIINNLSDCQPSKVTPSPTNATIKSHPITNKCNYHRSPHHKQMQLSKVTPSPTNATIKGHPITNKCNHHRSPHHKQMQPS